MTEDAPAVRSVKLKAAWLSSYLQHRRVEDWDFEMAIRELTDLQAAWRQAHE